MSSFAGRALRVLAGLLLIALGVGVVGGTGGIVLALVGLLPIATGLFNVCVLAPLIGAPLKGSSASTG
jgi:hypothetical protein